MYKKLNKFPVTYLQAGAEAAGLRMMLGLAINIRRRGLLID